MRQVIDVVESANEIYTAFYDIQIGETVYLSYGSITGERDKELAKDASKRGKNFHLLVKYIGQAALCGLVLAL